MTPTFGRLVRQALRMTKASMPSARTANASMRQLQTLQKAAETLRSALASAPVQPRPADAGPRPRPRPRPTPMPTSTPAPATASTAPGAQWLSGSFSASAGTRDYKLFVPPQPPGTQALRPLVVMLHGCTQDPDDFAAGTRMNEAALQQGFVVLYPAQSQQANPQRCWSWFKPQHQQRGRGEPALLSGMVRQVAQQHAVDMQRIYVAGLSAGGAMAAILGQAYPELFAAVGVHSGLRSGAAHDVPSAFSAMHGGAPGAAEAGTLPPTIVFHGDRDTTVHPLNGEQVAAASAGTGTMHSEQARTGGGHAFTRRVVRADDGSPRTEHWTVHGAGHAWSGGDARGSYTDAQGPDASAEMLRFFFAQRVKAA